MRKSFWLGLGLAALVGCGAKTGDDVNNSLPPNPPAGAAGTDSAKTGGGMNQPPSGYYGNDYPGMNKREGAGEAKTEGEAKGEGETKVETGADANETVTPSSGGEPKAEPKAEGEGDSPKTAAVTLDPEEVAQIEKIADPAERELALAQKLCPVGSEEDPTGGHLGAMGKPIKVEHDGKVVFLCCKGCEKQFQADPAKYVARAEAARKAK